ncbi:hypothetical protein P7F60_01310 [Rhizobium sp. YJ-22]|uniref:DUF6656 family protein n=1 Tax=Rhizobium sp. YJ-22 TaxID=3037556 RepID=UPI00241226D9|nr:DUF6656 family protein [Rhizobium sp. YJ-22]MDG3575009.1 hypothetical protein [Rhizobium sp. YJ-22]
MSKVRYFDASGSRHTQVPMLETFHSDFLRTGRFNRDKGRRGKEERRYLSHDQVAEITGRKLLAVGEHAHERLVSFHKSIDLPKMLYHRIIDDLPHLGYCHVTASKTRFAEFDELKWSFYIANFCADIAEDGKSLSNFNRHLPRMYFAIAMQPDSERKRLEVNREVRGNGLLFRTHDPRIALKNVLMLGARSARLREIIRKL